MGVRKKAAKSKATATDAATSARTIVYVHGIGNKPIESVLRCQWDQALMGFGLGERSRMAYWCQADRHGPPIEGSCGGSDAITARSFGASGLRAKTVGEEISLNEIVQQIARNKDEEASLNRLLHQLGQANGAAGDTSAKRVGAKKVGAKGVDDVNFPDFFTRFVTGLFLKDVRDFFFDEDRRAHMERRLLERLEAGNGPFVIVAHSQGTMIAYSVLHRLDPAKVQVPLLVTIGSPLGVAEARDHMRRITNQPKKGTMPTPACVGEWQNFFDPRDIVTQGTGIIDFYGGHAMPQDNSVHNVDRSRDPHSATGYLQLAPIRQAVRDKLDIQRFQPVAPFIMAADAVRDLERAPFRERRPLLIEITDPVWAQQRHAEDLAEASPARRAALEKKRIVANREDMVEALEHLIRRVVDRKVTDRELSIQRLKRYVSVNLTRDEAEKLTSSEELDRMGLARPPLYRVWRNAKKVALLEKSIHAVQASPAHQAYQALGDGIQWAVLDSGCTAHPHFTAGHTIAHRFDCTLVSDEPLADGAADGEGTVANSSDRYGHGTHVAGIIAGAYTLGGPGGSTRVISGIAPKTRLHIYKVLNDQGEGDDAWIIKALDHIARTNDEAGGPAIAGVNLSLGGEFEQGIFGCGHTPLCDELRRLWRQGVVVVLAAGNEGFRRLQSAEGEFSTNMSYSIGDPANLEEAIAVGAIHKEKPHLYGVSHFSSRGPTADGRNKPDCVAPGEQILSCRHNPVKNGITVRDLYYKLDGTSMAAPHVSGLIACFLSMRREFIGYPDRVKDILLRNCTDLGRERALQGAGMPNLVKMLVST
jgi:hypothetical protein